MTIANIAMATGFILIIIGLYGAMTNRDILRMIVGFTVAATGTNLVLIAVGYLEIGRASCRERVSSPV